ncbi:efflux RND transporter permease subunit [Halothermothrix orenii]|uniref:Acriflavin resistance protein n=1 Tax=Halothermothrix orenii (strain H 168 / OCM 544 / DSM 9562) TaxID=373903 RepID=B8D236_HALOH|nr:efflux RND transporter permease subunit [Halothermothrix orenii]ACL69263.1 acriflavin resistance protein [Halothermothrix orenii H 168]
MKLPDLAIKRPVTTTMIVLLAVLLGFISLTRVNLDLFPDMSFPIAAVITEYEGAGPHEVENMVTKPLEQALASVTNIKTVSSTSGKNQSTVLVEFDWGTDMDKATMNMREKIDLMEDYLPDEASNPLIFKFDPSLMPVMELGVSGEMDLASLKKYIDDNIAPRLERLQGVASVELIGGKERIILVSLDRDKMKNYNVAFTSVVNSLLMENINLSGGSVRRGNRELLVRTTGKFKSLDDIKNILIPTSSGSVPLKDIATVKDTFKKVDSKARMNKEPGVVLLIQKQTDANTVKVSSRIKKELASLKEETNGSLTIIPIMDQADYIERSIGNVGLNAIIGGILAVLILFYFLRNFSSTLIIATAIPVSVITTFLLIYFGGLTLNMMTLGGLALGIGMLVDNAIVVLENIFRYHQAGLGKVKAASRGSTEVGMAITASTLTTIIVFLPIVYVEGIASQLFKELALTVTFSLLASLAVALTLIPMLSSKIIASANNKEVSRFEKFLEKTRDKYRDMLRWCLGNKKKVVLGLVIVFVASLTLIPLIGAEFIPEMDQGQFTITAELPLGTSLDITDKVSARIEEEVLKIPEVKTILASIGTSGQMITSPSPETTSIYVQLKDLSRRERSTSEVMEELREKLVYPGVDIKIEALDYMAAGMGNKPISIMVKGDDLNQLERLVKQIKEQMKTVPGVREIEDSITRGRPELHINVDRVLAARYGLRVSQVATAVKTAVDGRTVTRYEVGGEEFDIRVKLKDDELTTPEELEDLLITSSAGFKVPLKDIASLDIEKGPVEILRDDQVRYASITASLFGVDLGTTMERIQKKISNNVRLPDGYEIEYGGQFKEMMSSFDSLAFAFILAVVLVYMVLAAQFESFLYPLVIMFTVPMSIIGVVLGLFITRNHISVPAIIGVIMLAGIVVNNAIVLVDYINTLRKRGHSLKEAILEAGPVRLRPVLMTASTTILGLLPLALGIGEGTEVQEPMAVVVIGGLAVSTILTLFIVPVLYSVFTVEKEA